VADPHGKFVWKDSYVFALNSADAMTMAHPIKPKLVGKNLLHIKDVNGVMIFVEFAKIAKSPTGKGWVDYMWPKPGEKKPSPKHTYIEVVPGEDVMMGSGYYE
jgi:signal transduction histidine kinase